jgi:hypothetical protein
LKLKYDKLLSSFGFDFNLRHYTKPKSAQEDVQSGRGAFCNISMNGQVGRCRLTVSKPELTARLVSALETKM